MNENGNSGSAGLRCKWHKADQVACTHENDDVVAAGADEDTAPGEVLLTHRCTDCGLVRRRYAKLKLAGEPTGIYGNTILVGYAAPQHVHKMMELVGYVAGSPEPSGEI